ncbi:hypothetical protein QYM36_000990, partial [Artemia franciscana]
MASKSNKSKILGFTGELIALGNKQPRSGDSSGDSKKISGTSSPLTVGVGASSSIPKTSSFSSFEKKWESESTTKKLKSSGSFSQTEKSRNDAWEEMASEVVPSEFISSIYEAEVDSDEERIESLICGCVKALKNSKPKAEAMLTFQMVYLAKVRPTYFFTEYSTEAVSCLLRHKGRTSIQVIVTGVNVLMLAYEKEKIWPESFVKLYIEDSINDRIWVDRTECKPFVKNIITAFGTRSPSRSAPQMDSTLSIPRIEASGSPNPANFDIKDETSASVDSYDLAVFPRFQGLEDVIEKRVIDVIQEQLSKRQDSISKNFLKFLAAASGIQHVRFFASQRLEMWLMNPKLLPASHELFLSMCANCTTAMDTEVVANVLKLRIKSKAITSVYFSSIKELIDAEPGNLRLIVLFLDKVDQYCLKDMWTNETERTVLLRIASEIPPSEDTLVRVLKCALSKDHPLSSADALDIVDQLVKRALLLESQRRDERYVLNFDDQYSNIIDLVLDLTLYKHPENIPLPIGYEPPRLAITTLYWKAWSILILLVCQNPSTLGAIAWDQYPILRLLMEMCITHNFQWPPPTSLESSEEVHLKEVQISSIEKTTILEFEGHLAAASTKESITENNSRLLFQLITFDPTGRYRKPGSAFLDQLSQLNSTFQLGSLLSRSRKPDFLLDILRRQSSVQSFAWLSNLIRTNEGALSLLPVQCLCEFLLHECQQITSAAESSFFLDQHKNLILYLRSFLFGEDTEVPAIQEVAEYFLRRIHSSHTITRRNAFRALKLLLLPPIDLEVEMHAKSDVSCVLQYLPKMPRFDAIRSITMSAFAQVCLVETEASFIISYLEFLVSGINDYDDLDKFGELIVDLSQLLVERGTMLNAVILKHKHGLRAIDFLTTLFLKYTHRIANPPRPLYAWGPDTDLIFVRFPNGQATTVSILVVHAVAILLAFGPGATHHLFGQLLDFWFPESGELPQGFVMNSTEEAVLFPDWLKLRMIRSSNQRLADAALRDLQPCQLILFIQSFGIPVASMTKMLNTLDRIVSADPFAFVEVDMDQAYIRQLLFVQWQRGAKGGAKFADILQRRDTAIPSEVTLQRQEFTKLPQLVILEPVENDVVDQVGNISKLLLQILDFGSVIRYGAKEKDEAHRLILKDLFDEGRSSEGYYPVAEAVTSFLHQSMCSPTGERFLLAVSHQPLYFSSILRALMDSVISHRNAKCYQLLLDVCVCMLVNRGKLQSFVVSSIEQALKRLLPLLPNVTLPP